MLSNNKHKYNRYIIQSYQSLENLTPEEVLSFGDMCHKAESDKSDFKVEGSVISMFPYPSGKLHMGHLRNYVYSDVIFRYYSQIENKNYIQCMGWDAFGSPAENASQDAGLSPYEWTKHNIQDMKNELMYYGFKYNWDREINTSDRSYYIYTQSLFKQLYENGYIYRGYGYVNYDPVEKSVLSNEQVIDGKGWRSNAKVVKKILPSYFFNTDKIVDKLYASIADNKLWPSHIINIQKNWVGQHEMFIIKLYLQNSDLSCDFIECATKTPKCFHNIKFVALSKSHRLAIEYLARNPDIDVDDANINTDIKLINPLNNNLIDVSISNNVYSGYGTGAVFIAECEHENDKWHQIIKKHTTSNTDCDFNYDDYDFVYSKHCYRLHHWCLSRQRVWGCPINTYICDSCGHGFYVDEDIDSKRLSFKNYHDLLNAQITTNCNNCNHKCNVCVETLDTFVDSSWYFLKYLMPNNFDFSSAVSMLPIYYYIGGAEHANLHLLYTQMILIALCEINNKEYIIPFRNLITQGMVLSVAYKNKDGKYLDYDTYEEMKSSNNIESFVTKMSKSKKNVISPLDSVRLHNSNSHIRVAIMSNYPIEQNFVWNDKIINTSYKFVLKVVSKLSKIVVSLNDKSEMSEKDLIVFDAKIKYMHSMYKSGKINNVVAGIHSLYSIISKYRSLTKGELMLFLKIIQPLIPSISYYYIGYIDYMYNHQE